MRRLTVTVMFAMAISAAMRADDVPKTIPLHESLKELEWLVGHWRSTTEMARISTSISPDPKQSRVELSCFSRVGW